MIGCGWTPRAVALNSLNLAGYGRQKWTMSMLMLFLATRARGDVPLLGHGEEQQSIYTDL